MATRADQSAQLQRVMEEANQNAAIQTAMHKLAETCWDKCISKPGEKLSSSEQNCLSNCAMRYLDSSKFIMKRLLNKAQQ